jgi:hypothetical protein
MTELQKAALLADELIRTYVERGDELDSLKGSHLGFAYEGNWASIGGYGKSGKQYPQTKILVSMIKGKEVEFVFDLAKIYNKIKVEKNQQKLFD